MNSLAAVVLILVAHLSYYDPSLCATAPINCFDPSNWHRMAAGHDARNWYGEALACPMEFAVGSVWSLPAIPGDQYTPARDWICLDRGGRIAASIGSDGRIHVVLDLLLPYRIVSGTVLVRYRGPVAYALLKRLQTVQDEKVWDGKK